MKHDYGSNCELILSGPEGSDADVTAYHDFYQLLVTYRFPMRYSEHNQKIIRQLSEMDKQKLESDELAFIIEKFKSLNHAYQDYTIETIPKSLYQLHVYLDYLKEERVGEKKTKWDILDDDEDAYDEYISNQWSIHKQKTDKQGIDPDNTHREMHCAQAISMHFKINNAYIQRKRATINSSAAFPEDNIIHMALQIIDDIIKCYEKSNIAKKDSKKFSEHHKWTLFINKYGSETVLLLGLLKKNKEVMTDFLVDIFLNEWDSRLTPNINYLYQGSNKQTHKKTKEFAQDGYTESFSDGVLGGAIRDAKTAMALSYILGEKDAFVFTITEIQKKLTDSIDDVIYCPRTTILMNTYGTGEFHHPRSRIARNYNLKKAKGIQQGNYQTGDLDFLMSNIEDNQTMFTTLNQYLKEHSLELISAQHTGVYEIEHVSSELSQDELVSGIIYYRKENDALMHYQVKLPNGVTKVGTMNLDLVYEKENQNTAINPKIINELIKQGVIGGESLHQSNLKRTEKAMTFSKVHQAIQDKAFSLSSSDTTNIQSNKTHAKKKKSCNFQTSARIRSK